MRFFGLLNALRGAGRGDISGKIKFVNSKNNVRGLKKNPEHFGFAITEKHIQKRQNKSITVRFNLKANP